MCGAAEAPAGGDLGDGPIAVLLAGELISAPAQPFLAHPGSETDAFPGEDSVKLANRDVAGPGGSLGRESRIAQVRERILFQLRNRHATARVLMTADAGGGP